MTEWIDKQIANGFTDLKGLSITATIPVKDRLINEALAEFLQAGAGTPSPAAAGKIDIRKLLPLVKKAEVRAVEGAVVLDVVVKA
jgi:hypothetical protein